MTDIEQRIRLFFEIIVFGWMQNDVTAALQERAYLLAALGFVSYTETLGGLVTGKLGVRHESAKNFRAFLPYLERDYAALRAQGVDLYDWARCGLVHEYFPKRGAAVVDIPERAPGTFSGGGRNVFNVPVYKEDFFLGARRYYRDLLEGKADLLVKFEEARSRAWPEAEGGT